MKIRHHALALVALLAWGSISDTFAGTAAKKAIETLTSAEGAAVAKDIIRFTGRFGQDQPQEWEVLVRRPDHYAMFIVDGSAVLSITKVRAPASPPLALQSLKVDSTEVFRIADKSAKAAEVGFDSLDYDLKPRADSPAPVWIVRLNDSLGITVGELHVAADSGSVLLATWDKEQLNRPAAPTTGNRGILADRRGGSVQTGSTREGVRDGLTSVGNSIRGVFRKGEVSNPQPRNTPKTLKSRP